MMSRLVNDETREGQAASRMPVTQTQEGDIKYFTITNKNDLQLKVISLGATITHLKLRDGTDIVLGYEDIEAYRSNPFYIGCSVGRVANRMQKARFSLDGEPYPVSANKTPHTLHGGEDGFNKANWDLVSTTESSVTLQHVSPSGDQGYPGTLTARVEYRLTEGNEVVIEYRAMTDAPTIVNMTNHTYFNLAGSGTIRGHSLLLNGDTYTPLDEKMIAKGTLERVKDTVYDFTTSTPIGQRIDQVPRVEKVRGYDINYNLLDITATHPVDDSLRHCATLQDPSSGRQLCLYTDQPGVQLYTGNFLDDPPRLKGKDGRLLERHTGVCLETQAWPNAINIPRAADQVILRPGSVPYTSKTVWALSY